MKFKVWLIKQIQLRTQSGNSCIHAYHQHKSSGCCRWISLKATIEMKSSAKIWKELNLKTWKMVPMQAHKSNLKRKLIKSRTIQCQPLFTTINQINFLQALSYGWWIWAFKGKDKEGPIHYTDITMVLYIRPNPVLIAYAFSCISRHLILIKRFARSSESKNYRNQIDDPAAKQTTDDATCDALFNSLNKLKISNYWA